jgi:hypothetical protein
MKMQHHALFALTVAVAFYGVSAQAAPMPKPNVHYMRADDLGMVNSRVSANTAGVVTKRGNYGQGYIYGRSVNNQLGNIVIWNAGPSSKYGKSLPKQNNLNAGRPQAKTALGPKLTYKPGYGKTTNTNDSQ